MTVNDLSYLSSPVTELFASSHSETQSRLSDADVGAFHELGFCAGIRVLTDEQVEQLCLELEHGEAGTEFESISFNAA